MSTLECMLGTRRELFVDDYIIQEMGGVTRRLNRPQVCDSALVLDKPWEGARSGYASVCTHNGIHYMYYRGWPWEDVRDRDNKAGGPQVTCLALSTDGVHWTKPDVGLYDVCGTRKNNVILADTVYSHNFSAFIDTRPGVPSDERFKALAGCPCFMRPERYPGHPLGIATFVSEDGINWQEKGTGPVLTEAHWAEETDNGTLPAFWSVEEDCYVLYVRIRIGPKDLPTHQRLRWIGRSTSRDFVHWSPIEPIEYDMTYTDEEIRRGVENTSMGPVEQLYTLQAQPYFRAPHICLAFPNRLVYGRQVVDYDEMDALEIGAGAHSGVDLSVHDALFMTSRNTKTFELTSRDAFIRPGPDRRNWGNRNCYVTNGMICSGDGELSLYFSRYWCSRTQPCITNFVRCAIRVDGFMSINAPYSGGTLLTRPLVFGGNRLEVNYATSAAGRIGVEMLDVGGHRLDGFSMNEEDYLVGDEVSRIVSWQGDSDVSSAAGRPIRLRFVMKDADLYSFRFSNCL